MRPKKNPHEKFTIVSITIEPSLLNIIDERKGKANRSAFMKELIKKSLGLKEE